MLAPSAHSLQAQWVQTNGPYGGQINSLVSVGSTIFTTARGAVLYSTNNGTTWGATELANAGVDVIANEGNKLIAIGAEIYVSVDEGVHWSLMGSSVPWLNLQLLAASNTALFVSANNGLVSDLGYSLYRSTDDGATWTSVGSALANAGVNAIAFNGDTDIYAGTISGVYISPDNGGSWISAGLANTYISAICTISEGTGGTYIFAATRSGILRSTNGGANWTSVNAGMTDTVVTALSVCPKGTGTPAILAGTQGGRVYLSENNGENWTDVSNGLITGPWEWGDWEADVRSITVVGSSFFACTNAGLFLSTNNGAEWGPADAGIISSLTINAFAVCGSEPGTNIFAGSFPSGVFLSTDEGSHWGTANNGINSIDINAFTITGKNIFAGGPTGVFLSTNNGANWDTAGLSNTGEVVSLLAATNAEGNGLILAGTWNGLFISSDNGKTWNATALKEDVTALAADSNQQGGMNIFAGTRGSGIFLSTDQGVTWNSLHNGIPVVENINALCFGGENLFAATDYILYHSTDNGTSWAPTGLNTATISSNTWICSLAVDTIGSDGSTIFAGTSDHGVLVSVNAGVSWAPANTGLTDLCAYSLAVSSPYLFAGTNASGVWKRRLSEMTAIHEPSPGKGPQIFSLNQNYPNPFNPSTVISYQLPQSSIVTLKVYDIIGREVSTLVSEQKNIGQYEVTFDGSKLASGVYFYRLQAGTYVETKKLLLLK